MDIERIELKLLHCLVVLVEERSVTRAAERLGLSQPRVSNSLRRLRELAGDPLLVRAGQRLVPTDRAIMIAGRVQAGLNEIAGALSTEPPFEPATSDRAFKVMMSGYTAVMLLPGVLRRVRPIAPDIKIFNQHMSHANLHQSLDQGDCDLAFGYLRAPHPNLRISNCFSDDATCIGSIKHWGQQEELSLDAFAEAHHISMGDSPGSNSTLEGIFDRELQLLGRRRSIVAHSPTPSAVARIVAATDLLAIMSTRLANDYARHMPLRCFKPPIPLPSFDIAMVWHERSQKDVGHAWIREQFRKAATSLAPVP
ncbi:MAG TPA: LysR family transcriptional regulator [Sphingobium sp.]